MRYLFLLSLIAVSGCADRQAFQAYTDAMEPALAAYYAAASQPLLDLKLPAPDGKEYHLLVNREVKPIIPSQIKDSEWTGPVQSLIQAGAIVGGLAVMGGGTGDTTRVGGDYVGGSSSVSTSSTSTSTVLP
jgi:hypothetical protein